MMPVCIAAHLIYRSCTRKSLIIFFVEQKNVKKEYKKYTRSQVRTAPPRGKRRRSATGKIGR
jgi:hypothetical protein